MLYARRANNPLRILAAAKSLCQAEMGLKMAETVFSPSSRLADLQEQYTKRAVSAIQAADEADERAGVFRIYVKTQTGRRPSHAG